MYVYRRVANGHILLLTRPPLSKKQPPASNVNYNALSSIIELFFDQYALTDSYTLLRC